MAPIKQLDPHVADLIAAGEVVERPASAVKELAENAIDAGATAMTVELQRGGLTLLRVTDNGCGIPADQAETAFLRHATSKLSTRRDLEAISTLGFRGEALAAIAAVSRIDLLTRTADTPLGLALSLEAGRVTGREEAGCPIGTTIVVRDLFFNTPARLKFLKKDAYEGAAVFAAVQRLALSHPERSVKFIRDGRQELFTAGDGDLKAALYAVLGRDLAAGYTPVRSSGEGVSVSGYVSLPACCRGSRAHQFCFVNGRHVHSRTMVAAVEEAYKNRKMVGKFPGCALHLTLSPGWVDVNVHPAKTEVKFSSDRQIFDAVYYAVSAALDGTVERPAALRPIRSASPAGHTMTAAQYRTWSEASLPLRDGTSVLPAARRTPAPPAAPPAAAAASAPVRRSGAGAGAHHPPVSNSADLCPPTSPPPPLAATPAQTQPPPQTETAPEQLVLAGTASPATLSPWRLVGEVFDTYALVEQGDTLLLIDKHAAHERIWFDRLKAGDCAAMAQPLLTPEVFVPAPEEGVALLEHLPLLATFGFELEDFGGGALLVRQVPDYLAPGEVAATLSQLAAALLSHTSPDPQAVRDELLHSMACKAAVKGGQKNGPAELDAVARAVVAGAVTYCPHGRPVAVKLTRRDLEKRFGRS